jgi:hypothetical protein
LPKLSEAALRWLAVAGFARHTGKLLIEKRLKRRPLEKIIFCPARKEQMGHRRISPPQLAKTTAKIVQPIPKNG